MIHKDYFPELQTKGWTKSFRCKMNCARHYYGKPINISKNGGYRTKANNKKAGGVPGSYHVKGRAVDIPITNKRKRFLLAMALWEADITYVMIYSSHIHADDSKRSCQIGYGGKSK